jgi:hypothetical protein
MTRLEIDWPDEMQEQVRAARGRLERAGEALRTLSIESRLQSVTRVLEDWTRADSPWRRELIQAFAADSPFAEETVREGLDAAYRAWKPADFAACARRELSAGFTSGGLSLSPFEWTAVLAGGSVPMPTMLNVLIPLVLGSPVLMREASNDRITAPLLKRSLEAQDETLARALEHLSFGADDVALESLLEAPCVVATGSDETIRAIADRLQPSQRFLAYGHRFSIGVLGGSLGAGDEGMRVAAEGFALDVARWDQTGCLSPVILYLVGTDQKTNQEFARLTSEALDRISLRMPRGDLTTSVAAIHANERAEARMRAAAGGAARETVLFEGPNATVVLEADTAPRPAPLYRFLRMMPVASAEDLARALRPFARHLSNVAVAGFSPAEAIALRDRLLGLGASRVTEPGRLQTPPVDWPHDGMPLFTPIARFGQTEDPTASS